MDKLQLVKAVTKIVVGLGTSTIVTTTIKNQVQPNGLITKITVPVASFALAGMATDAASKYAEARIDSFVEGFNDNSKNQKTA